MPICDSTEPNEAGVVRVVDLEITSLVVDRRTMTCSLHSRGERGDNDDDGNDMPGLPVSEVGFGAYGGGWNGVVAHTMTTSKARLSDFQLPNETPRQTQKSVSEDVTDGAVAA